MRILELAADLDRVRLSGAQSGLEREHSILQLSERINLCRRGHEEGIDVNKVDALSCANAIVPLPWRLRCLLLLRARQRQSQLLFRLRV